MANGNKFNNGVWEQGTPEIVLAYQHDTPGQKVEEYVEGLQLQNEKKKLNAKKQFTQVFDNPLKGFPYNEEFEVKEIKEEAELTENYRKLAKHGMGTETPKSVKVGTEIDYYQKDGAKYMGKVTKMSKQSYTVRDDKTKKDHEFFYHDRIKAAKLLKQGDNVQEGKGTDIFQKYSKVISRLSSKEQDEILDALYTMNTQSGGKTKEAHSKVKELLNLDYTPEGDNIQ